MLIIAGELGIGTFLVANHLFKGTGEEKKQTIFMFVMIRRYFKWFFDICKN